MQEDLFLAGTPGDFYLHQCKVPGTPLTNFNQNQRPLQVSLASLTPWSPQVPGGCNYTLSWIAGTGVTSYPKWHSELPTKPFWVLQVEHWISPKYLQDSFEPIYIIWAHNSDVFFQCKSESERIRTKDRRVSCDSFTRIESKLQTLGILVLFQDLLGFCYILSYFAGFFGFLSDLEHWSWGPGHIRRVLIQAK